MKKILLGTSALAAVALTAGSASAGAPKVVFDGAVTYDYVFYDNDNRTATGAVSGQGHSLTANEQQSELHWTATGSSDNGLEYTARMDWRVLAGGGSGGGMDESWVKLGGGWGSLVIGQDDGAEGNTPDANSLNGGPWMTDGNNMGRHMNQLGTSLYYFSPTGATGDANKLAYYTPNFSGFSAIVSFTPNTSQSAQAAASSGGNDNTGEIGLKYSGDFSGVGLTLAGAYIAGTPNSSAGTELEDIRSYHLGGLLSVGDFGVGLGYIDSGDSGTTKGSTNEGLNGFNASVSYSMDSLYLNGYYQNSQDRTGGNTKDNEFELWGVAATYTVAEGLSTYAQFTNTTVESGAGTGSAFENDANILVVGTKVSF